MSRRFVLAICLIAALLHGTAEARQRVRVPPGAGLTISCIEQAAMRLGVPLAALLGILATEGGQNGEALSNTNGTWDMGPFQVNTCHINMLLEFGIRPEDVLANGCVNADAAALILRRELRRSAGDLWEALGAYHSRTTHLHHAYRQRLQRNLKKLEQGRVTALIEYVNGKRRAW